MYQYDDPTVTATLPTPAVQGTGGFFTNGNPATGVPATILTADFMNMLMMEVLNVVLAGGLTPSKTAYNQLLTAINNIVGSSAGTAVTSVVQGTGITVTRTGNTVTIALSGSAGTAISLQVPSFLTAAGPNSSGVITLSLSGQALPISSGGTGAINAPNALLNLGGMGAASSVKQTGVTIGANQTLYNTLTVTAPGNGRLIALAYMNLSPISMVVGHNVMINGANTVGDIYNVSTMEITSALVSAGSLNTIQQSVVATSTPPSVGFSFGLMSLFIPAQN